MKSNNDIMKYLSDFMTEREKEEFERELSLSDDLKNRTERQKALLNGIKNLSEIKEESPYFQNLLPRVRNRMEKKKSFVHVPKWAYLFALAAAVVLIVINVSRFTPQNTVTDTAQKTDTVASAEVKPEVIELYQNDAGTGDTELMEANKRNSSSFEVGVGVVTNKQSIREIVNSRVSYPVEDYLLALR